jgi:hypothetical protein
MLVYSQSANVNDGPMQTVARTGAGCQKKCMGASHFSVHLHAFSCYTAVGWKYEGRGIMKQLNLKAFSCAALALLVPIFAQAAGSVTLSTPVQSPSGASVSSGLPVTITVNATPVGGALINTVNLIYSHNNGTRQWWVTNAMTWVSGVVYSGVIPPLPTGTVSYRVSCRFNDVETTQTALAQYTVLDVPSIDSGRYMPFETLWANPVGTN